MVNTCSVGPDSTWEAGFFQNTVYQDPAHLCNYSTKKCLHFNYLILLHHVSCAQKWLIWTDAILLWFDSLTMDPWRLKHVRMFSEIL